MHASDLVLPVLLLAVWVTSWWLGTRRFRLWFALLAPVASVAGIVLALIGSASQTAGPCSTCSGGGVQQWAADFDSPSPAVAWLGSNSLAALGVAVVLAIITLIAESVLMVLEDSRAARAQAQREGERDPQ